MAPKLHLNLEAIRIAGIAIKTFNHWKLFTAKRTSGYVVSRSEVGDTTITLARLLDPKHYEERHDVKKTHAMPDSKAWEEILREHTREHTNFVDIHFPHDERSIHRDVKQPSTKLKNIVKCWRRIRDIATRFVRLDLDFCLDSGFPICKEFGIGGIDPTPIKQTNQMDYMRNTMFAACVTLMEAGLITHNLMELDGLTNGNSQAFFENGVFDHLREVYPDLVYSHIMVQLALIYCYYWL